MDRITQNSFIFTSIGSGSWTCPAGVTQVILTIGPAFVATNTQSFTVLLTVVPNTTYTITINGTSNLTNATQNSFGSFVWSGGSSLYLRWVE